MTSGKAARPRPEAQQSDGALDALALAVDPLPIQANQAVPGSVATRIKQSIIVEGEQKRSGELGNPQRWTISLAQFIPLLALKLVLLLNVNTRPGKGAGGNG